MIHALRKQWFLLLLGVCLFAGLLIPAEINAITKCIPRLWLIAGIILATALPIDFASALRVGGAAKAIALAVLLSTIAAPLLGYVAGFVLPTELAIGLIVAAVSPCTLASGAVWTRRGGGNDAITLTVTVLTNLACFAVIPLWAAILIGKNVEVDATSLAIKLLFCVALPIALAQMLRTSPTIASWTERKKSLLSLLAQIGVLTMALVGAVAAGLKLASLPQPLTPGTWAMVAITAAAVHTSLLLAGWYSSLMVGLNRPEAVAVAIAGSQKTLALGIGIALEFGGLAIFPMIAYHILQLVIDTLFADRVRSTH